MNTKTSKTAPIVCVGVTFTVVLLLLYLIVSEIDMISYYAYNSVRVYEIESYVHRAKKENHKKRMISAFIGP